MSPKVVSQTMDRLGFKDVLVTEYAFKVSTDVKMFVDVMESAIPILKEEGKKEKYSEYLLGKADAAGEVEMSWEALIITGRK